MKFVHFGGNLGNLGQMPFLTLPRRRSFFALALFGIALASAAQRLMPLPASIFVPVSKEIAAANAIPAPVISAPTIPTIHELPNPMPSAHSASLVDFGNGQLGAAWFAGSAEGASDVSILFSRFDGQTWSKPTVIVNRAALQGAATGVNRVIRKLGNPVLWLDAQQRLHLWFVSVSYGGWAGSSINHQVSLDHGIIWQAPSKLITSPFWNISTLVRTPPVALADGGFALPVYHEFLAKRAEMLRLDSNGNVLDKQRISGMHKQIQPTVAASSARTAVMLTRDASGQHRVHLSQTTDGGQHWSSLFTTNLPNPDASIAMIRLKDGRLLLAYNPQENDRTRLALAVSSNNGVSWSPHYVLESGQGEEEYSYPAILQDSQGNIHVAYTWQRKHIRMQSFSSAWLDSLGGTQVALAGPANLNRGRL